MSAIEQFEYIVRNFSSCLHDLSTEEADIYAIMEFQSLNSNSISQIIFVKLGKIISQAFMALRFFRYVGAVN